MNAGDVRRVGRERIKLRYEQSLYVLFGAQEQSQVFAVMVAVALGACMFFPRLDTTPTQTVKSCVEVMSSILDQEPKPSNKCEDRLAANQCLTKTYGVRAKDIHTPLNVRLLGPVERTRNHSHSAELAKEHGRLTLEGHHLVSATVTLFDNNALKHTD